MTTLALGAVIVLVTLVVLAVGVPVAFALGGVAAIFLYWVGEGGELASVAATFFGSLEEFTLVAIPMFVLIGAAASASHLGSDISEAVKRWLHPFPGGRVLSGIGAAGIFAGLSGSSPATVGGIGREELPGMLADGYPQDMATGSLAASGTLAILIPPSLTMVVFGIATDTDIGRLFLAGLVPGLLLLVLFMGVSLALLYGGRERFRGEVRRYSLAERLHTLPRLLPALAVVAGVVVVLVKGVVEASEAAGVGAILILALVVTLYGLRRTGHFFSILRAATRESVMILMIIAGAAMFGSMLLELSIPEAVALWVVDMDLGRWTLILWINVVLLALGCFLPPVAVILMTVPLLIPLVVDAGFDPVWLAVMMTLNMQIGLITPPVGLNLQVVHALAPAVPRDSVLRGAWPFMLCMVAGIVLLCLYPELATALPDGLMGPVG